MSSTPGFPHEHISNARRLKTIVFSESTAATFTVHTPGDSSLIFVVYYAEVENMGGAGANVCTVESDATGLHQWRFPASATTHDEFSTVTGFPYFIGRAAGEVLKVTLTQASQVNGSFLVGEIPPRGQ